ncbi:MmpS family transport accessory protein [Kribbella sp. NPDC004875]|uniref:MmpS family transport accessory protein n=1 Tax=Kribbella sp. NPDC004875 TaxID=3364107 RepID=UPI00369392BB
MTAVPPQPPARTFGIRRSKPAIAALGCVGLVIVVLVGGSIGVLIWGHLKTARDIRYEVSGTVGHPTIFYQVDGDEKNGERREQTAGATLPWSMRFHTKLMISRAFVQAVRPATSSTGTMACTLWIDGKVVAHETAGAEDPIVSCAEPDR